MKYKELKYKGKIYYQRYQIEEILIKEKLSWFIDIETFNARIEITESVLIFNGGTIYNGIWEYGVIRNAEIINISWRNGVIFNVVWRNGVFEDGIIFNCVFHNGKILKGKLRQHNQDGSETKQTFIDCVIDPPVVKI